MSCGCPVIGANTGGNPEVVQDAAILLDPMDTSGLETAIRRVIADPALRDDLARRGLRRAVDFGWDKSAAQTLALLHELYESG
jgi:glycosyltransferase involved in cell wall biosynthesis